MTQREAIHQLIDALLDISEKTDKGISFHLGPSSAFNFTVCSSKDNYNDWIEDKIFWCHMSPGFKIDDQLAKSLRDIERLKNTQKIPEVEIKMTLEKAKELGLIA